MREKNIYQELKKRILVLDGAMGTMIQRLKLNEEDFRGNKFTNHNKILKGNNDILSITQPNIIANIHRQFIEAGADIIETNSFNSNSISQSDYGLENYVYELNYQSAKLAKEVADSSSNRLGRPIFVAGSVGPTNRAVGMSPDVNNPAYRNICFDELADAYYEQIKGLAEGGADIFLIETIFDTLNAKAALYAVKNYNRKNNTNIPVMLSATIADKSGRILSGQTIDAFITSVSGFKPLSIGLNCSFGAKDLNPHIKRIAEKTETYVSVYPNAGLPNQLGEYEETPDYTAGLIKELLEARCLNIVGGCCGTTPEHIRAIASIAKSYTPRVIPDIVRQTVVSGLEEVIIDRKGSNFINIGERTNVAGSKKFARLIRDKKYDEALSVARNQIEGGAAIIDINTDDALLDAEKEMITFLRLISGEPDISKVPIMVDSSKWEVIESALKNIQGKAIVNSISLKEGEESFRNKAGKILDYGAAVVVMAFDEDGQATDFQRKTDICERAYNILLDIGFNPYDIIFDVNILSIGTGIASHNNYAVDYIEAVRWIKQNLKGAKTSGGVSNLSFSFRGNNTIRESLHSVFLYHAINAGLDMAIVNPSMLQIYDDVEPELLRLTEDLVLNRRDDATERLIEAADRFKSGKVKEVKDNIPWRLSPLRERLIYSVVKGNTDYLSTDLDEAIYEYKSAISIIEDPLMTGMNKVGQLFGEGKMFLPQVVKSARVMKQAVDFLTPLLEKQKGDNSSVKAGKIILATVKGDVHDIGKNIVNVVLSCNNFEVIDLGVMVDNSKIIEEAHRHNADIIGVSGLITPSLSEMEHLCKELENSGSNIPVFVGGATTSLLHTAVKLANLYKGGVFYGGDASQTVSLVKDILKDKTGFINKKYNEFKGIRDNYYSSNYKLYSLNEARDRSLKLDFNNTVSIPKEIGIKVFKNYNLNEIAEYIDWTYFFHSWQFKGIYPHILSHPERGEEAAKLFKDAKGVLKEITENDKISASAVIGIFPAVSQADNILVFNPDNHSEQLMSFPHMRQQNTNKDICCCLSDFIASKDIGITDHIGFYALSAGLGAEKLIAKYKENNDDYKALLVQTLTDRLAEAFSELLHEKIRKEIWGYAPNENLSKDELFKCKYRGIRPAYGYPACPEHSSKSLIFDLLHAEKSIGIELTANYAINPASSVCGMYFAHPDSYYFSLGKIDKEQMNDYLRRRGDDTEKIKSFTEHLVRK